MSNCANHAFWLGMTESGGLLTDIDGNNVLHAPWDIHSNPDAPEPNDSAGEEQCIRMKGKHDYHFLAKKSQLWLFRYPRVLKILIILRKCVQ